MWCAVDFKKLLKFLYFCLVSQSSESIGIVLIVSMFQTNILKMDDGQVSDLSDWEPSSLPDLSTNDSHFVPSADEESDEEKERVRRRSKRKTTGKWSTRREVENDAALGGGWAEQVEGNEDEGYEEELEEAGDEGAEEEDEEVGGGGDAGTSNVELTKQDQTALTELNYDDEDVEDFLRRAQNANTRSQTELVVEKYHRVMSAVSDMENNEFLPLDETDRKDVPRLLARFFKLMRTKKGDVYNASSYTTFLNGFGRYLMDAFEPPIDVAKDPSFAVVRKVVKAMKAKAQATKGKKAGDNKSKVRFFRLCDTYFFHMEDKFAYHKLDTKLIVGELTTEKLNFFVKVVSPLHLRMCWAKGTIGRNAPEPLTAASYFVVTTGLGCRTLNEVLKITNDTLVWGTVNPKTNVHRWVRLDEQWVCKNRVGDRARQTTAQITADDENPDTCMVRTLMALRERKTDAQNAPKARLLWKINHNAKANPQRFQKWYKQQPLGKNQMSKVFTDALVNAGIDPVKEGYKLSSTRKVLVEGALDSGMPETMVGKLAGHRSNEAKASYVEKKDVTTRAATIAVSRAGAGLQSNYQEILEKVQAEDDEEIEAIKQSSKEGLKRAGLREMLEAQEDDEDEVECTFSQTMVGDFGTLDMEIKETSRKRKKGNEEQGEEMRQENKRLRQLLMRQRAQLHAFKSDEGGSGMQVSHPASTVMNNGWGQNALQANPNSASWQQPTGMGQQNFPVQNMGVGADGQFFQQLGLPSFFQQPRQPSFYRQELPPPFGHQQPFPFGHQQPTPFGQQQPTPFHQQQRPAWTGYLGNASSQVCLLNFYCSKLFILVIVSRGHSFTTKADLPMLKGRW